MQMPRAYIHGAEGMGFLSSLTFPGVLLGPWDMNWEIRGIGKKHCESCLGSAQFLTLEYLTLCGLI